MMIKEAAVRYSVSRAKLHRLVQLGRLRTAKDPRDERVTLLRTEDVEALFRFPQEEEGDVRYQTGTTDMAEIPGKITPEWRARIDALRERIRARRQFTTDSVEIIREEREKRTQQILRAAFGEEEDDQTEGRDA